MNAEKQGVLGVIEIGTPDAFTIGMMNLPSLGRVGRAGGFCHAISFN
jgi:hypothetical protein